MSIQAVKYAIEDSRTSGQLQVLLICLAYHANPEGKCWPSVALLCAETKLSRRNVQKYLRRLEGLGEIRRVESGGGRRSTTYLLSRMVEMTTVGATTLGTPEGFALENQGVASEIRRFSPRSGLPSDAGAASPATRVQHPQRRGCSIPSDAGKVAAAASPATPQQHPQRRPNSNRTVIEPYPPTETPSAASKAGGGVSASEPTPPVAAAAENGNGWHGRYYDLLSSGLDPIAAVAKLREEGLLPAPAPIAPKKGGDPPPLQTMGEIIAHARRAAERKEPFDFVDPQPQVVKIERTPE
jgi:hypothetical protein